MIRTSAPKIRLPRKLRFRNIHKEVLKNNFPLHVVSGSSQNICELTIQYRAGRFFESKRMLAVLCATMMNKGTRKHTAYEIAEFFDFYGATVHFKANMYTAQISLYCLSNLLPNVLPMLIEILQTVDFPEKEIKKTKAKIKQKLAVQWEQNGYIASQHFNQAIFGINHPFGYFTKVENLHAIEREDLRIHQEKYWQLNKGSFAVVAGNIQDKEIQLLNKYLGNLKVLNKTIDYIEMNPIVNKEIFIKTKNEMQASIRVGMPLFSIHHNDYADFEILNTILGGYFGSRLMSNIREEKGYTYGIYSFNQTIMDNGYFCIATDVGVDYKKATMNEIEKEIKRLKEELVGDNELSMVKNYLIGQYMKRVDGALNTAKTLKSYLTVDADLQKVNEQIEAIHYIAPTRLQELANKYLDYENMYKIVVG